MRTLIFALALWMLALAACASEKTANNDDLVAVAGYVHAGPVCPVVQDPPDSSCDDRPVAGATLLVYGAAGSVAASVTSSVSGQFEVMLTPGDYVLEPQPVEGLLGTAPSQDFTVDDIRVALDVAYDTGIR